MSDLNTDLRLLCLALDLSSEFATASHGSQLALENLIWDELLLLSGVVDLNVITSDCCIIIFRLVKTFVDKNGHFCFGWRSRWGSAT
ncbi:hypothetical protein V6N13_101224 [Hibiscus sabdariffa]